MRIRGLARKGMVKRLAERVVPGPLVLYYHRVAADDRDPQLLCVAPARFERQIALLAYGARVVSLSEIEQARRQRRLQAGTVAVTFDDGYADNFLIAAPIMRRYGIKGTFFVTTGNLGTARQHYWDELASLLLEAPQLPSSIRIRLDGQSHRWTFADRDRPSAASWNVLLPPTQDRQRAYIALCGLLQTQPADSREAVVRQVADQVGFAPPAPKGCRTMTEGEVRALDAMEGMTIGAHTVTHPSLASLPPDRQRAEIESCKIRLEEILGRRVTSFAYPYGTRLSFSPQTRKLVEAAGYEHAWSTRDGPVRRYSDRFALPRICVRDWDDVAFKQRVLRRLGPAFAESAGRGMSEVERSRWKL